MAETSYEYRFFLDMVDLPPHEAEGVMVEDDLNRAANELGQQMEDEGWEPISHSMTPLPASMLFISVYARRPKEIPLEALESSD